MTHVWGVFRKVEWEFDDLCGLNLTYEEAEKRAMGVTEEYGREWKPIAEDDEDRVTTATAQWGPDGRADDITVYIQKLEVGP